MRALATILVVVLATILVVVLAATVPAGARPAAAATECASVVDEQVFASEADLRRWNATIARFGLRTTASPAHRRMVDWLDRQVRRLPGVTTTSEWYRIRRWLPLTGDLESAGVLFVAGRRVPVAGAIPYSRPALGSTGERFGWPVSLESAPGEGTTATIVFA